MLPPVNGRGEGPPKKRNRETQTMGKILTQISNATGMEKIALLAVHTDLLNDRVEALGRQRSIDEQVEVFDLEHLASVHGTTPETLRKQIAKVLGDSVIVKVGKQKVIRKSKFLEFLELQETGAPDARDLSSPSN